MATASATRSVKRPAVKRTPAATKAVAKKLPAKRTTKAATTPTVFTIKRVAEIPDQKFLTGYINRTIDGLTDFQILDAALEEKDNVLLEGDTGTGKTSCVYAYAAARKMALYSLSSSAGSDPSQWRGHIVPTESGGFRWQDGALTDLMRYGGILLVNEINFLPDRVASDLFGALDKRRKIELVDHEGEVIYAPDDFLIVGDMNPGYSGTRELNAALRNRFAHQILFDYDPVIEAQLVKMPRLREVVGNLRDSAAKGNYDTPVSTNMMMEFERIALKLNLTYAIRNFVMHFPQDDRASVKQVFDFNLLNLETELDALKNPGKSKSKGTTTTYDDDWEITDELVGLYTASEMRGLTLEDKREWARSAGIDSSVYSSMKVAEITKLLLGPVGGHPYWTE